MSINFTYVLYSLSILVFTSMPSVHIHTPRLFQVELEKDGWEYRWTFFGVKVVRT